MPDTQITHTIGRRKEAVCRVYLKPGSGKWDINGRTLGDYFPRPALVTAIQQPGHCLWRVRKPVSPQAPDE